MKIQAFIVFILLTVALFSVSCSDPTETHQTLHEGIVEYKTFSLDAKHPMAMYMPDKASVKFKQNSLFIEMYAGAGFLYMAFISNPEQRTFTQLVKILDIEKACVESEEEIYQESLDYQLKFKETKETKMIAGYKCRRVKATKVNDPTVSFDVYYTTELGSDSINNIGPYKAIKGMLMEYRIKKFGIELCFVATKVKQAKIDSTVFKIPSNYVLVSREAIDKVILELM